MANRLHMSNIIGAFVLIKRLSDYGQTSQRGHREQDNHPHERRASLRLHEDFFYRRCRLW